MSPSDAWGVNSPHVRWGGAWETGKTRDRFIRVAAIRAGTQLRRRARRKALVSEVSCDHDGVSQVQSWGRSGGAHNR